MKELIKKEFADFRPPKDFAGGCQKSKTVQSFCAHFRPDGTIGKLEQNCVHYRGCPGFNFKYNL